MSVIIIGAGIAGLAAASELSAAGVQTTVLEARGRIGGRIHTIFDERISAPIELGAEFVHGEPPEIFDLAKTAGLHIVETEGNSWYLNEKGDLAPSSDEPPGSDDELWEIAESYVRSGKPDLSFEAFLRRPETYKISDREKEWSKRFVAGFHAAELEKVGIYGLVATQKAEESINGTAAHRITNGYSSIADVLQQKSQDNGAKYLLDNIVTAIQWDADPVRVTTCSTDGQTSYYEGSAVIVTLPAGVLKSSPDSPNAVRFSPEIEETRLAL